MSNITKVFNYKGTDITFIKGDSIMINATEMARKFGKRVNDWFALESTKAYLSALEEKLSNTTIGGICVRTERGNNGGTWMHRLLALEFARWLSAEFSIWCNERILELMKYGVTATDDFLKASIDNPDYAIGLLTQLKQERQRNAELAAENAANAALIAEKDEIIEENKPKVTLANAIENSETLILIRDMAKQLKQAGYNTGGKRFREQLIKDGYLTTEGEPSQRSMELKIMRIVESVVTTPHRSIIRRTPKITGKGQTYFCNKYLGFIPQGTVKFPTSDNK